MSYIRAEDVLPKELIETIQQYVNGKAIYIPSISKKAWEVIRIQNNICKSETSGYIRNIRPVYLRINFPRDLHFQQKVFSELFVKRREYFRNNEARRRGNKSIPSLWGLREKAGIHKFKEIPSKCKWK